MLRHCYLLQVLEVTVMLGVLQQCRHGPRYDRIRVLAFAVTVMLGVLQQCRHSPRHDRILAFYVGAAVRSASCHDEHLNIFRPRQRSRSVSARRSRKRKSWDHTFFCLASKSRCAPPSPMDRGRLMQAGRRKSTEFH